MGNMLIIDGTRWVNPQLCLSVVTQNTSISDDKSRYIQFMHIFLGLNREL
jgi:hypothetical protein